MSFWEKDSKKKKKSSGWGSFSWGEEDFYADSYGDGSSSGWGTSKTYKSLFDAGKIFKDASDKMPKNENPVSDYAFPNRYELPEYDTSSFVGCLFWLKDINDTDKKLMEEFGRQARTVISILRVQLQCFILQKVDLL